MMSTFVAGLLLSAMLFQSAPPPPVSPQIDAAAIERLAVAAERALPSGRHLRLKITSSVWATAEGAAKPDLKNDPFLVQTYIVVMRGRERLTVLNATHEYVNVWTDGAAYNVSLAERRASSRMVPCDDAQGLGLQLLLQIDLPIGFSGTARATDAIRTGTPIAYTEAASTVTFRFVSPGLQDWLDRVNKEQNRPSATAWATQITMDIADPPRVLATAGEQPKSNESDKALESTWNVDEWHQVGDMTLPRVVRIVQPADRRTGPEQWTIIKVEAAEAIAADAPIPQPLPDGIVVTDESLQLTFTIGSRDITYQGRTLRLVEPLTGHPGGKLEERLGTAVER